MPLSPERLTEIVQRLASRPGHEAVRVGVAQLLTDGLGARDYEVRFEAAIPEARGIIDALVGRTVFEFKSNLRTERADAEEQLTRYLAQRERETGERYVGLATDGATFIPYALQDGALAALPERRADSDDPRDILAWLGSVVVISEEAEPDPVAVRLELGRDSVAWRRARDDMRRLYENVRSDPEARTKRALWSQLLARVYGSPVDDDGLFFQHTYLTIIAKAMAAQVIELRNAEPAALLSGREFEGAGIYGAAESDFFDWPLRADGGAALVERIARQAGRFRFADVQADVLKGLYESLIDPEQRHLLGEYYTPDWLAESICREAVRDPFNERVLDPACGSGAFLFHAVRRFLAAADAEGLSNADALARCCDRVIGVDVHPVAVQIARVTYLLAFGDRLRGERGAIALPVYLGDSLQWNTEPFLADRDVLIAAPPDEESGAQGETLHFPATVARDPALFDQVISRMLETSANAPVGSTVGLLTWLGHQGVTDEATRQLLKETYERLCVLRSQGRDHIWGFAARNLVRPVWLSQQDQRPDVLIGNPPWLAYRYMDDETQTRFREECRELGLWAGGRVATHQDHSAYFYVRCAELYLRSNGRIAFVMPYAAMSRQAFEGFRKGAYPRNVNGARKSSQNVQRTNGASTLTTLQFTEAWALPSAARPLFPVPSCALFADRGAMPPGIENAAVYEASGVLPKRDASTAQAESALEWRSVAWPPVAEGTDDRGSDYQEAFRQGATLVPRLLCVVERSHARSGVSANAPRVTSRRTPQEKQPWKARPPLSGSIEAAFLRPLYLGESIAPYRPLAPAEAVIPWSAEAGVMDAQAADEGGFSRLADWMRQAEALWEGHKQGRVTLSKRNLALIENWDYWGKLSAQFPIAPLRVVYTTSGTLPASAVVRDDQAVVDSSLYWFSASDVEEARYLTTTFNSETARERIAPLQSRGQWGARHFDKLMLTLPIPRFDGENALHLELAALAADAERVAGEVELPERAGFVKARQIIRAALAADGVAQRIDARVAQLLG